MSRRKPKLEYAIICDDIRQEVGHKLSYIGIYGLDITVPGLPFTFPQICAAISYRNLKGGDFFTISGKDPSGRDLGKKEKGAIPKEQKGPVRLVLLAKFVPLKIEKEGDIKLQIVFNDDKKAADEIVIPVKVHK